jgi:sulfite exporter TauE/SafE/copper chaperone CopZ
MADRIETLKVPVDGMTCSSCELRIETALGRLAGVREARASASLAEVTVTYDAGRVGPQAVREAIGRAGYRARQPRELEGGAETRPGAKEGSGLLSLRQFLGLAIVGGGLFLLLRLTGGFSFLPTVSRSMGYGLIFVVGLLTSLHCIAMCGGINLSQTLAGGGPGRGGPAPVRARLRPGLLYNGGRLLSYTLVGGAAGALGSVFQLSAALRGAMPALAGLFMLFIGIRMLGVFPWLSRLRIRLPGRAGAGLRDGLSGPGAPRRGPLFVGLLNGLMPCGPLQTMQVYALGTGGFLAGALSMFLFSLGTVPLMFGFGALSSLLSARFNRQMMRASGVLVAVLGVVMFTRGLALFGVSLSPPAGGPVAVATLSGGVQTVTTPVESGRYVPLIVQRGVPLRWVITARAEELNGCNNPITIPQLGIRRRLVPGDNLIEFTPEREGRLLYTCWMGMISSSISVVEDLTRLTAKDLKRAGEAADLSSAFPDVGGAAAGSCCSGSASPRFAGGKVPTDAIQVARLDGQGQVAEVRVDADGYTPAVLVLQRGVKATIRFEPAALSGCTAVVDFPSYSGRLDLARGQLETPPIEVLGDFIFRCGMGMLNGYVKVVDDLATVDLAAVRREVDGFRASTTAAGCCGY